MVLRASPMNLASVVLPLRGMKPVIPDSVARLIAAKSQIDVGNLFELNYLTAVSLRQLDTGTHSSAKNLYVRYFCAEQEKDSKAKLEIVRNLEEDLAVNFVDREDKRAVLSLLEGRALLESNLIAEKGVDDWLQDVVSKLPTSLIPYATFLSAMAYLNRGNFVRADSGFAKSASQFHRAGQFGRELISHLHRPSLSVSELALLRSFAKDSSDTKALNVANFELARKLELAGDIQSARMAAEEAKRGFLIDFVDPRRIRIVDEFLRKKAKPGESLKGLEAKLWRMLAKAPRTKPELIESLFGSSFSATEYETYDTRLRSMIYRINRKSSMQIQKVGDQYALSSM